MEYVQMTLGDWMEMKQRLKQELQGVKQSFVRIGYALRKIDDQKLYEQDGYKSVAEFAKAEYGLEASTVSRFMSINREYSIDGYSERLRPEYLEMGRSQLEEMLRLPDADRQMIRPEASRQDIRDLKNFNKTEHEAGIADDIRELIRNFFKDFRETKDQLIRSEAWQQDNIKGMADIVNPSGSRSYKKGLYFLMMYDNGIKAKKYPNPPQDMEWREFFGIAKEIFQETEAEADTYEAYSGIQEKSAETDREETGEKPEIQSEEPEQEPKKGLEEYKPGIQENPEEGEPEIQEAVQEGQEEPDGQQEGEKQAVPEIAPAQKSAETLNKNEIPEEEKPTVSGAEKQRENPEIIEKPFGTRKEYLDSLYITEAAVYIAKCFKDGRGIENPERMVQWVQWLKDEVYPDGTDAWQNQEGVN